MFGTMNRHQEETPQEAICNLGIPFAIGRPNTNGQQPFKANCLILVCLLTILPVALGQGITGHIIGTVQDSSNAVVPNALVTITNQETGIVTHTKSNAVGEYRSDNLPPGTYRVKVAAPGFRDTVSAGNIVTVDSNNRVDVNMQVGKADQTVEVTAQNPLVDTTGFLPRRCTE